MPFLSPNQQRQSTEGKCFITTTAINLQSCWHGLFTCSATCAQSCATTRRIAVINLSISVSSHLVSMTSLAAVPRQLALDVRGRGPVAAVPADVNKQYWSALFDQLIVQQSLPRVSFQLDRCQQLDSVTSAYHYRSSSSRLSTPDRCGIKSTRRAPCARHRHHIRALQLIDTFKVALKTLYLFDSS